MRLFLKNKTLHKITSLCVLIIPIILAVSVFSSKINFGLPKISYGIDLVGGGQIILQVDSKTIVERDIHGLEMIFGKSHQLNKTQNTSDKLFFLGKVTNTEKKDFADKFPNLNLIDTDDGFEISGIQHDTNLKTGEAVVDNIVTLRSRLNSMGVADISVYRQGQDKIVVEVPKGNEIDRIKTILSSSAEIGFYDVASLTDGVLLPYKGRTLIRGKKPIVQGSSIVKAVATVDQSTGLPIVSIGLDSAGGKKMGDFTASHMGKPIITTMTDSSYTFSDKDNKHPVRKITEKIVSVASVNGQFSKDFMISGLGSLEETENLALILRSGALTIPMYVVSESSIDSRLGEDNARLGFVAFAIGLAALALYVVYLYRLRGLFSIFTLIVNASLIVIVLSIMGASLTMTGLAGIILTMGMAVDANIIVIEREKELIGNCKKPLLESFKSSALPILDANATTLLVAIVLYNVSSVSLKGFSITLALGVVCTVIGSYYMNMYFSTAWMKEKKIDDVEPVRN